MKKMIPPFLTFFTISLILEAITHYGFIPEYIFPAPSQIIRAIHEDFYSLTQAFYETFLATVISLILSLFVGVITASLMILFKKLNYFFMPYMVFFQTVPIVAIAPILVIWFGFGMPTVIASSFIVSVFPLIVNTYDGLLRVNPSLLDLFKLHQASSLQIFLKLRFPNSIPSILNGLKVSAGLAVIGAVVGEFIAGSGLGSVIDSARTQQKTDLVFGAVTATCILGLSLIKSIEWISHRLLSKWKDA